MDREIRQTEQEPLPKNRDTKEREQYVGGFSRTALEESNDGIQQKRRKRDHKEEKEQTKRNFATGRNPKAGHKDAPAHYDQRQDHHRQLIGSEGCWICPPVTQGPQPYQNGAKPWAPLPRGEDRLPVKIENIQAQAWDQHNV